MQLDEFIGNDQIVFEISEAVKNNTLPHAILIEGAHGTGKQTLAGIIAQSAVCIADYDKPCGICSHCKKVLHGYHPDITTVNGENSGELSVDSIRHIRSDAYIKPNEAAMKVYILLNCDKMLIPAQNAFLKILEEPPANVLFILTVTSSNMLLPTVRSRVRLYSLYAPSPDEAAQYIQGVFPDIPTDVILTSAKQCGGNIGQTIEVLNSGGEEASQLADKIIKAVFKGTEYELLVLTNQMSRDRVLAVNTLDRMLEISAQCVEASLGAEVTSETASGIAKRISKRRLIALTNNISRARKVISTNVNLNFFGTWLSSVLKV